jgi:CheY-like chemotaxis protein
MEKANILLVDDIPQNLLALKVTLEELDCNIITANSGPEALRLVMKHDFALVLLDVQMPNMNGFEMATLMRGSKKYQHIPIIFVTAISKEEKYVFQGYEVGAVDYLFKPIDPDILRSKVKVFLDLHHQKFLLKKQTAELKQKMEALEYEIGRRKKVEKDLLVAKETAEAAARAKSDFLASMSHELRTPLNAMIGYTALTLSSLKKDLPLQHLHNLEKAERSARALLQLINNVLDFSKIEAGKMDIFIEEIDLAEIIEDITLTTEGLLLDKPVELKVNIAPELPSVDSDYTKIKQILNNLVGNAVKFTPKGYVAVHAASVNEETAVRIEVEDTGTGIPHNTISKIFESFQQVDGSIKKRFGGTGLGLAITKKFCELLNIEITVESEEGQGTTFCLTIPVQLQTGALEETRKIVSARDMQPMMAPTLQTEFKTSVLYLGDPELLSTLESHFTEVSVDLQRVETVSECIEKINAQPVWAIIVDPAKISAKIIDQLKNNPSLRGIPIITHSMPPEASENQAGTVEFFSKTVTRESMMEPLFRITRMQKGEIMVVDDDPDARELYGAILAGAGYTPNLVASGKEALELLDKERLPQAILLDLLMPGMNGFQVLEHIQAHTAWKQIPIVVLTSKTLSDEERELLREEAQILLEKGKFSIKNLAERIETALKTMALAMTSSVLVVDDNEENLELFGDLFQQSDYRVYKAKSGPEGIEIAKETIPDMILMDLAMPDMDGFEATQLLKQHPTTSDIPVIACSAFATQEFKERAFQVGCEGYITKPVEPERLVEQVAKIALTSKIRKSSVKPDEKPLSN